MTDRVKTCAAAAFCGLSDRAPGLWVGPARLRTRLIVRLMGGCAVAAGLLLPGIAVAQDADDAPVAYVDIGSFLRYEEDDPGDEERAFETRLGAGYFLATSGQRLSFEGELLLQALEDEPVLTDPAATLSYAAFTRGTELSFDLSYTALDLEDRDIDEDFDAEDLTEDGGRRERIEARVGLVTGRDAPFGTATELTYRDDSFSDGATEEDETFVSLGSTLRFTIDPRITLRATGFISREETDDVLDTVETIESYGLGADLLIDPVWTANIDIGYLEIETDRTTGTTVVDGATASLLLTRDMPNGELSFSATRDISTTGSEDTFRVRRALTLANGAELEASLGAISFEGSDPIAIYGASFATEFRPGSRVSLAFDRSGGVTDDDENVIRTSLSAAVAHNLTESSSLAFDVGLSQVEDASLTGTDTARVDLSLAYRYALTEDWTLAAQATRELLYEDGTEEERTTTVLLGIERRFSFRP
ncbi:hypothetical protein [Gymnodinialimonas ulvae]|uniref:hypothetical protein n=1 Tax=Gymnodinialimonas ulvae TaxID=3126504 RepID=UPI00309F2805